jgi:hypothetical protein
MSKTFQNTKRPQNIKIIEDVDLEALEKEFMAIGTKIVQVVKQKKAQPKPIIKNSKELQELDRLEREFENIGKPVPKIVKEVQKVLPIEKQFVSSIAIKFYRVGTPKRKSVPTAMSKSGTVYYEAVKDYSTRVYGSIPFSTGVFYNVQDNTNFSKLLKFIVDSYKVNKQFQTASFIESYVEGFYCTTIEKKKAIQSKPNFLARKLKDDVQQKAINSKYTRYEINNVAVSFEDLITIDHCDYVKNNFHKNCCFLTAIIDTFYNVFEFRKSDGKRKHKELTYKQLCSLLNIEYKESDIACCVEDVIPFFTRFKFGLYVYDIYMNKIYAYKPKSKGDSNKSLRVILKDNHVYRLNFNLKSLEQISVIDLEDASTNLKVAPYYYTKALEPHDFAYLVDTVEDIFKCIQKHSDSKKELHIKLISNNIELLCAKLIEQGSEQKVYYNKSLYKMTFQLGKLFISVEKYNVENIEEEPDITLDTVEEYEEYTKTMLQLKSKIINDKYISYKHPSVLEVENAYPVMASIGCYDKPIRKLFSTIDENKAYTECARKICKVPKFQYFDVYRPYDNSEIKMYSEYVIELLEENDALATIFNSKFSRVYGFLLKFIKFNYKIHYFREPYEIVEVGNTFKDAIDAVFQNSKLSVNSQKKIVNVVTGLLEKRTNKKHETKIFYTEQDAEYYASKLNGKIIPIFDDTEVESFDFDDKPCKSLKVKFYCVNVEISCDLVNGFTAIKDMIYNLQKIKMYNLYLKLKSFHVQVFGVKTDCFLIEDVDTVKRCFPINKEIGGYKIEYGKTQPSTKLEIVQNKLISIPDFDKPTIKTFSDEFNIQEITQHISKHKTMFIKGKYPGTGKSYSVKCFDKNTLFIMPYRELCQDLKQKGYNAITFHSFFGLDINDCRLSSGFDYSSFSTICFDEAYLLDPRKIIMIDNFIRRNPDLNVFGCGDLNQCESIQFNDTKYINKCIDIVFRNQIKFEVIKRCQDKEDAKCIMGIYQDLFISKLSLDDIIKKYNLKTVKKLCDVKTVNNICYFNATADNVNNHVHEVLLNKTTDYYVGMVLKCKVYTKLGKNQVLNTNYKYRITRMCKDSFILYDAVDNEYFDVPIKTIHSSFKLPYCSTIESIQGKTIEDDITIFDMDSSYMSRNKIWTCLTRVVSPKQITVFINSDKARDNLFQAKIKQYFNFKVLAYKSQDKAKNRTFVDSEYIDTKWFAESLETCNQCYMCHKTFDLDVVDAVVCSDITADRIDNDVAHTKANCRLACLHCNVTSK